MDNQFAIEMEGVSKRFVVEASADEGKVSIARRLLTARPKQVIQALITLLEQTTVKCGRYCPTRMPPGKPGENPGIFRVNIEVPLCATADSVFKGGRD